MSLQSNAFQSKQLNMNRSRFCKIRFCENESGTKDSSVRFFRAPKNGELRDAWHDRISKHQTMFANIPVYKVCERHFTSDDFTKKHNKWVLKNNAVPSVFDVEPKLTRAILTPKTTSGTEDSTRAQSVTHVKSSVHGRRYCKIKYCENERGTNNKDIIFFCVPTCNTTNRFEWIKAISRYQEYDFYSTKFMICENHFNADNITTKHGKHVLKNADVPTFFCDTTNVHDDSMIQPQRVDKNSIPYKQLINGNQFCKIKLCPNETRDNKNISFFRVPLVGDLRIQWIDAISSYQEWDFFSTGFMICELHFPAENFTKKNGMKILKRGACPSIFDIETIDVKPDISSMVTDYTYIGELPHNFIDCDIPVEANSDSTPHEIEFVSLNESCPVDQKSELPIDSSNTSRKRKFDDETAKTDEVTKRGNSSSSMCNNCEDLHTELLKAKEKIGLLENFILRQKKTIKQQHNTIIQLRKQKE